MMDPVWCQDMVSDHCRRLAVLGRAWLGRDQGQVSFVLLLQQVKKSIADFFVGPMGALWTLSLWCTRKKLELSIKMNGKRLLCVR